MNKTEISWCDLSFNPITGCSHASTGCEACYAEKLSGRYGRTSKPWTMPNIAENLAYHPGRYLEPVRARKPAVIFTCSMGDLYHERVDWEELAIIHGCMLAAPQHVYLALTKRPQVARAFLETYSPGHCLRAAYEWVPREQDAIRERFINPPHTWPEVGWLWLGTSAEDQANYDRRAEDLIRAPVAHRFLSLEPLLGPIELGLGGILPKAWGFRYQSVSTVIDWVIGGGESAGIEARQLVRPFARANRGRGWEPKREALAWARSIRDQCALDGVPFLWKQWGGPTPKSGGRELDGAIHDANPARDALQAVPSAAQLAL